MRTVKNDTELSLFDVFTSKHLERSGLRLYVDLPREGFATVNLLTGRDSDTHYRDQSRGEARYVVVSLPIRTVTGSRYSDVPNFPYVVARRLNDDGSFDEKGEWIAFSMDRRYDHIDEVTVVGRMALTFVADVPSAPESSAPVTHRDAPPRFAISWEDFDKMVKAAFKNRAPGRGVARFCASSPLTDGQIATELANAMIAASLPVPGEVAATGSATWLNNADMIGCFLSPEAHEYFRKRPMHDDRFWSILANARKEAKYQGTSLPFTLHQIECGAGPQFA